MRVDHLPETTSTYSSLQKTPIAIVGMASIFPQAENIQQYWDNIISEVDCITEVPPSHWNIADYYDPDPNAPDKTYSKRGGFIPYVDFNPMDFGIPPNILEATDISQLLSLVVAKAALEDAGYGNDSDFNREQTGVILGVTVGRQLSVPLGSRLQYPIWERVLKNSGLSDEETQQIIEKIKDAYVGWQENSFPGILGNVVAGRIANRLNLGGTNCVVDAACASTLGAVKMAISELLEHRSNMMLVGGVDTDNSILMYMCFSKTPAFSKNNVIRPFDADSDGMIVGEGIGMLVLKRLEDAKRDNDRIYAVIRGFGASSDGRYKSIYAPRPEGQILALKRAYQDAGVSPDSIGLIEAHGTGTLAGDHAEVTALTEVFSENNTQQNHIALGSVKSQIGHTKAAAGAASLIKTALALYHKVLPPTINITEPHPSLKLDTSPFYLNTHTRPWIRATGKPPRRAGVSSFGFGGTNFHIILEESESEHQHTYRLQTVAEPVLLTAETPTQLLARCEDTLTTLQGEENDTAYQELLAASRAPGISPTWPRIGFVAESRSEACQMLEIAITTLKNKLSEESWTHPQGIYYRQSGINLQGRVVALFPGQGSQYLEMGRTLALTMPPLRETYCAIDTLFSVDNLEPVSNKVFPAPTFDRAGQDAQAEDLRRTEYAQPAIAAFSAGLYKLMQQAGFQPDFVVGHSFGELTALWAAQVLDDQTYFSLVKARGQAMAPPANQSDFDAGAMLAVSGELGAIQTAVDQLPGVTIANLNANNQVVLAGPKSAIEAAKRSLTEQGYRVVLLPVSAAFHTALVGHAQRPFAEAIRAAKFNSPQIPVYANTTGGLYPSEPETIKEILADHLLKPVLFKQQIENIYAAGGDCFIEIGPRDILTNLVRNILGNKPHLTFALNPSSKKDSDRQFRETVLQLQIAGLPLGSVDPYQTPNRIPETKGKGAMTVRLNANNYLSEKTRLVMEKALQQNEVQVTQRDVPESANHSTPKAASPTFQSKNGTLSPNHASQTSAETSPTPTPALSQPPAVQPPAAQLQPRPLTEPDNHRALSRLEQDISQFVAQQNEAGRVHEQFLNNQGEYAKIFFQLMKQQYEIFSDREFINGQTDKVQSIVNSVGQSIMRFHDHQAETGRIHTQYLTNQGDHTKSFFQLLQQQYATMFNPEGSLPAASTPALTYAVNGHNGTVTSAPAKPAVSPASISAPAPIKNVAEIVAQIPEPALPATPQPMAAPAVSASAATEETVDLQTITNTLFEVVGEKTGYPLEVLELDMDVEADLGIDSIKRVEILSAMQDHFPALPQVEPEGFGELRTLRQIIDFVKDNLPTNSSLSPLPATAQPMAAAPAVSASAATEETVDLQTITNTLFEVVGEKTGYPLEVLELDMDVEADLGIDSIKRVEILSAMQDHFPALPQVEPEGFGELRTLRQIIDFVKDNLPTHLEPANDALPAAMSPNPGQLSDRAEAPAVLPPEFAKTGVASPEPIRNTNGTAKKAAVSDLLCEVFSENTGLPIEVLEPEIDLEDDLGIDRVKRVEILGIVRDRYPQMSGLVPEALAGLPTLSQIIEALAMEMASASEAVVPEAPQVRNGTEAPPQSDETATPDQAIYRHEVSLKSLLTPDFLDFRPAEDHSCLLTDDGSSTTVELAQALSARGWQVVVLSFPRSIVPNSASLPAGIRHVILEDLSEAHLTKQLAAITEAHGPISNFIAIMPANPVGAEEGLRFFEAEKAMVKQIFLMAKHLKQSLNEAPQEGRNCFLTVARLDGQFGLSKKTHFGVIGGGLFGLTKTLNQEWPTVFCRALDVNRLLSPEQAAAAIIAELHDPDADPVEVGYSSQGRVTLVGKKAPLTDAPQNQLNRIDRSSVFVVSGGAKGITAECVIKMAGDYQCQFILLGRSSITEQEPAWAVDCFDEAELKQRIVALLNAAGEKATPIRIEQLYKPLAAKREVEQTLRAIKLAGGQAHYLSVDITDSLDLNTKLAKVVQTTGPITGLIHGAGNIADKWIEKKTAQDFDLVYDTKVKGLENLLQCVPVEQLAQVILFSSIAGFQGNIGQADYALANEVLNKAAHLIKLYQPACRVVSLNWGPWDGGMVTPTLKRIMAQQNIAVIPIALGTQMLVDELNAAELDTTQVVYSSQQQPNSPLISSLMASESRSEGSVLRTSRIYRNLRLEVNPFLHDHVIGGQPVLPFTCAIDWMVNASEQLHPNYRFYEGTNLKLLKGIVFPEISERVLILDLKETSFSSNEVSLEAKIWSQADEGQVRYHYQGQVRLVRQLADAPTFEAFNLAPNQSLSGPELYQNGTLFHGPYFQGVNRVLNINAESLTMQCFLPAMSAIKQGQFPVKSFNPYTTDVQLHSGLIWTNHFYQEGCLPTKLAKLEQFAAIPHNEVFYVTTEIVSKTNTTLVVNSVSHNEQGQIYTRLLGFEATVSKGLATIFEQAVNGHHLGAA